MTGPRRLIDLLSGFGLTCVLLVLLLGLTWLGTLAQVRVGLHESQKLYFDTFVWWQEVGPIALPMPGAQLLLWLLFVNIVCGGIVRIRKNLRTAGVLVAHCGIVLLLLAGLVKFTMSEEGYIRIHEGQTASTFRSHLDWELAIARALPDGRVAEYVVPLEDSEDLAPGASLTFVHADLPFDLTLTGWQRNSRPQSAASQDGILGPAIDGFRLRALPLDPEAERNAAGAYVEARWKHGGDAFRAILWGLQDAPWTVPGATAATEADDAAWTVDLRKRVFPLPFAITLDRFTKQDHPGIDQARDFRSRVTREHDGIEDAVEISMNEPMRHAGYILYQSQWGPPDDASNGAFYSVFAVSRNPSDQWPLIACVVIGLGLAFHFVYKLVLYILSQQRGRETVAGNAS